MDDKEAARVTAQLGATLSDLVANVYGLVTENEGWAFGLLANRMLTIEATANAIIHLTKLLVTSRLANE